MSKNHQNELFNEILVNSIDEALSSLGENAKTSIYFHLEKAFMIRKQDIPCDVNGFSDALEQIFGLGAKFLELLIMKKLYEKARNECLWEGPKWLVPDFTFREYVELMRICYEKTGRIVEIEVMVNEEKQCC